MARALALFAGPALLAGCYPQVAPQPAPTAPHDVGSKLGVESLAGEWRVAGIDGREFNEPYGLALSANERAIWWEPRCAGMVRGYRIAGSLIFTGPDPDRRVPKPGDPPSATCRIALPPRLADVMRALSAATTIERTAENGVLMAGGEHSLLLFSQ